MIYDLVDPNANLIFGAVVDESYSGQVNTFMNISSGSNDDPDDGDEEERWVLREAILHLNSRHYLSIELACL